MYLGLTNFTFPAYEVGVTIDRESIVRNGIQIGYTVRWNFEGRMQVVPSGDFATDQANVSQAILQRETAFNAPNQDVIFYFDDGTPSAHQIIAAQTSGGTRIVKPLSFPYGKGAEYSTFRNWTAAIEADYYSTLLNVIDFRETLTFTGNGGPIWKYQLPLNGPPIAQTLNQYSLYSAVQSGRMVGLSSYPVIPQPLFPYQEQTWRRQVVENGPDKIGQPPFGFWKDYEVLYTYFFESNTPLVGTPQIYEGN